MNVASQAETSVQPAATSGNWIDISNRQTVQSSYLNTYLPTAGVAMNWTGSVAADSPGTTSQAYQNAVDARINWFRGMAGVPAGITLNASYSQQDQAAALMFSANNQISHSPPSTWTDYSSAGANAAANSNICLYYGQGWTDSGCIALYIQDGGSNNSAAGHRRWLLYPQTQQMGTGDVPVNGSNDGANAVWVFDGNYGTTRPPTRDGFVAWPPPGYVPYQVVYPRWSFSYPNADFSNATVTMTTQGTSVPVTLQPLANGYGENTLVWVPNNEDPNSNFNPVAPSGDTTTSITISNVVVNGSAQTFSYSVIVFDPGQTSCSYSLGQSGQHFASSGGSGNVSVSAGSGCAWMASANATWISITSGSSGSGNGTVNYTVSPNTSTQSRSGTISVEGQTFTISQDAASSGPTAMRFVPVTPCRVADTRNANGAFGGPYLSGGTSRDFAIPNSKCGIPATAQAYSLNVTAVPLGGLNYLTVWPSGEPQPNVSTLNSTDGRVKANAAIVAAGNNGAVSVYATDSTQVILDIDGYFVPATNTSALAFYPMTSCRVVDTRQGSAPFGGPALNASETRTFPMLSGGCNIPSTAQAYSLNVTAVPHGQLWYLTAWPSGFSQPNTSTLNSVTGTVVANAAIVPAGNSGEISIYVTAASDVILDINGYFAPPATGGLSFYGLTPCRALDTRSSSGQFNGTLPINIGSSGCGAPSTAQAFAVNATAVPAGTLYYVTLWPNGQTLPNTSNLNSPDGSIVSNMAIVGTQNGSINAFASNPTQLIVDLSGYFAP